MKVQCDGCERAGAAVLCCADQAALCWACDEKIHAANKLAGKHQRVPLFTPDPHIPPKCDICQEKAGYFFCLEDRALLCGQCDESIHTASPYVRAHQRFLITGVKVSLNDHHRLQATASPSTAAASSSSASPPLLTTSSRSIDHHQHYINHQKYKLTVRPARGEIMVDDGGPPSEYLRPQWPLAEILALGTEFDHGYGFFPEMGSSGDNSQ